MTNRTPLTEVKKGNRQNIVSHPHPTNERHSVALRFRRLRANVTTLSAGNTQSHAGSSWVPVPGLAQTDRGFRSFRGLRIYPRHAGHKFIGENIPGSAFSAGYTGLALADLPVRNECANFSLTHTRARATIEFPVRSTQMLLADIALALHSTREHDGKRCKSAGGSLGERPVTFRVDPRALRRRLWIRPVWSPHRARAVGPPRV